MASLNFYLYQFLTFVSPAVVVLWVIIRPLQGSLVGALGFLLGTLYVGFLHRLNTWNYRETSLESVPYRILFVFVSFFLTLTVLSYAWLTPWKMGWITRAGEDQAALSESRAETVRVETVRA